MTACVKLDSSGRPDVRKSGLSYKDKTQPRLTLGTEYPLA